jgi:hypothetical protein
MLCRIPSECSSDLEREERISSRCLQEAHEQGTGQRPAEPALDHVVQRCEGERSRDDAFDPTLRPRAFEPQRHIARNLHASRQQQADARRQPPCRERQRPLGRRIEPLHVVDRQEHRPGSRELGQHGHDRCCGRTRIGGPIGLLT